MEDGMIVHCTLYRADRYPSETLICLCSPATVYRPIYHASLKSIEHHLLGISYLITYSVCLTALGWSVY
ncbi:hypothetical protein BDQ94DRAFT_147509 [Aspergillus welwitschiae]|uniref:Uncharacterized protein n=1 Tax=Aspergillus welwitschiae TaxID=1341132 RepID=A0A3F3PXS4_9EURO|nr:hypothetical protein BDQ94DRAFT_147509 [Aspergillus welwitschiae]RDH31126.1 hypothetical protein BDQ94DRAFT_147509 [Aspergillus welwitschiae]